MLQFNLYTVNVQMNTRIRLMKRIPADYMVLQKFCSNKISPCQLDPVIIRVPILDTFIKNFRLVWTKFLDF